jgi:hypothetical protein
LLLRRPADSLTPGACLAQDARVVGGGEHAHVHADLGDQVLGGGGGEAGDGGQPGDLALPGAAELDDPGGDLRDLGVELVDVAEHPLEHEHVAVGQERAVQGLLELAELAAGHAPGELGQGRRVALASDDGVEHVPAGRAVDVGEDRRQLQVRVLQELLRPLLLRRAGLDEVPPVAGAGPEAADVLGGHEAALQGPALGDHGQPGRVQLVRLGPSGQCLDLRRLVKRAVKPGFLQQEVHGLPVVAVASIPARSTCHE